MPFIAGIVAAVLVLGSRSGVGAPQTNRDRGWSTTPTELGAPALHSSAVQNVAAGARARRRTPPQFDLPIAAAGALAPASARRHAALQHASAPAHASPAILRGYDATAPPAN